MNASVCARPVGRQLCGSLVVALIGHVVSGCGAGNPDAAGTSSSEALGAPGLVAAYSFNEGVGTTAGDSSGNSNTATLLNGAGWAVGHSGSAANFDGINDTASAGNVSALNSLTAVTVSAWVKGSVGAASPDAIIVAKDTAFALVVDGPVEFGVKSGSTWFGFPSSTTNVTDGNFHFLTGVYDGTTIRVYVDGVQQATQNIGVHTLNAPTAPLEIASCIGGPNCDASGEMWHGLVDDVRIYNRALSQTEIQTDRDTPVSPLDTIAPSAPTNVAGTALSLSQIQLTWTASTDNVGVTGYQLLRNGSLIGTSVTPSFTDTGLAPATTYTYTVTARDAALNTSALSSPVSVTTQADTSPPTVPTALAGNAISPTQISLTWAASTDNVAVTGYRVFRNGSLIATSATLSFADTGLSPSTTYTYTVAAIDGALNVSPTASAIFVTTQAAPDTTPPTVPGALAGTAISPTQINLTWAASTDNVAVTGYRVFRNSSLIGTSATTSFADSGLTPATSYTYTVAAIDAALNQSGLSAPTLVTTPAAPDTTPPTVPGSLAGTAVSPSQVNLTWAASTDNVAVTGYQVFRNSSLIGTSATTSFADTGLAPSTTYTYTVAAIDAALNQSGLSAPAVVTTPAAPDTTAPSVPGALAGTAMSSSQVNLTWAPSTDNVAVAGYRVFRNTALIGTSTTTSFADTGLAPSTSYTYTVAAIDAALNQSGLSAPAVVTTPAAPDTTAPSVPGALAGTAMSSTQINLTWAPSTDNVAVAGYRVFRNSALIGTSATTSFADSGLTPSTAYTYAVAAIDAALNQSALSTPVVVSTQAVPDTTPPTLPSNLVGTATSSSQINLTWTPSTDNVAVTGYQVFRDGSLVGMSVTASFTDTGLTASTSYGYAVAAIDAALNTSGLTAAISVTTQAANTSTVLASDNFDRANGGLGTNWTVIDSDPRIVSQHVEETLTSDGNDSIAIYTGRTWPANQYSQITVRAAGPHNGCAAAVRTKNDPVIEMYFVYVTGPLGPGARLTLAKFVTHHYTELWTSVLTVNAGDVVYLSANATTLTVKLNGAILTTQVDGSITAAGFPALDVTDYDGQGLPGDGQCDNWEGGSVGDAAGGLAAPANVTGTAVSSSQINLSWTASTGATGYKVFRNGTQVGTAASNAFSDVGLALGTSYTYAVSAFDASGNISPLSTAIVVTTVGDTTPPSVPANLVGTAVSSNQINLTWAASTDDVGITGYRVFRNGTLIGTSVSPSFADSGLTPATTYTYSVAATDAALNASAQSAAIPVTTQASADTTPPTVPTGVLGTAISSSQINLTWTASTDNIGVTSYRVFRNGLQVGTTAIAVFTDSGLLASTAYSYTVVAVDLAGNSSAASTPVSVTTPAGTTPSPPIVAFAFDEGTGLIANDSSGNNHPGTLINGPTWSTGHTGSAVNFDGLNDYVSAGNISTLNRLTAVTVSAWIKGSIGVGSADAIIVAKDAAFALVVSGPLQFGVMSGNNWFGFPSSSTRVDDGAFHYVTGVYDGTAVRIYVDGALQATQNVGALTLNAPTTALEIASCFGGPNCDSSGERWHGLIDDVRVYNRALSATEIVADMMNAVH